MKPPFEINQEIVCIAGGSWVYKKKFIKTVLGLFGKKNKPTAGPALNEHCWCEGSYYVEGIWFIRLFGYDGGYDAKFFRALETNSISLKEQAKEVLKVTTPLIHSN